MLVTPRSLTRSGLDAVAELEPLRARGIELVSGPAGESPTPVQLEALLEGCDGWIAGVEHIDAATLEGARALRVISRNGTGVDAIDLAAAERAGITVVAARGANAQGVAELALTLALMALRQVPWSAADLQQGRWTRHPALELAQCRVGVVGLGAIGAKVAQAFSGLGAEVVGYDPVAPAGDVARVDLRQLVRTCDVITLHAPPVPGGRPLIGTEVLDQVRPGAVLVNTARASLVDDDAVLAALADGRLTAYAVDAFDTEPPELGALLRHPRTIATPHLGAFTTASVSRATSAAVDLLLEALDRVRG
ncbi:MAG TPA: NAD(P)-dependent oxidoreductase [Friedmanniella sp.]